MNAEAWMPWLLLGQALVGGADTLVNHELIARLPWRVESRQELVLHAMRESIYGALFIGLALFAWHGAAAWIVAALLAAEVLVTAVDEFLENRTRKLPDNERLMHVFLTINLGLIIALMVPVLAARGAPAGKGTIAGRLPEPPMIVTIFRNRLKADNVQEYYETAGRMSEIARSMPGYLSHKTFTAEDGERVTIVEFADEASQRGWSTEVRHQEAKKRGRAAFYTEYKLQVCEVKREHDFTAGAKSAQEA